MTKLWTKNFTIITMGTVVSMLGNAVAGFAIGLMVLDYTESTLLYAIFMICYSLPRVILPLLAGPYLDRFSRKKTIYLLDFFSAALYAVIAMMLFFDLFNYIFFLALSMVVGSVDSVYSMAYESLYPTLISKGNFGKAYAISSLIYPIANTIMVPIAGICYNTVGLIPLFIFNSISFLIAAIVETRINADETHIINQKAEKFSAARFKNDLKDGVNYLRAEPGLMAICAYFFVTMMAGGAEGALVLPFFKSEAGDAVTSIFPGLFDMLGLNNAVGRGVAVYTVIMSISTFGRLVGGALHYKIRLKPEWKFAIAVTVYTSICFLDGSYLFLPVELMMLMKFITGFLAVNSFNIRISSTQNYVPNEKRGRFNGISQMIMTAGTIIGQLMAGAFGEITSPRLIIVISLAINLVAVFGIMVANGRHVKRIYNNEV